VVAVRHHHSRTYPIAVKVKAQTGAYPDILNQPFHQMFAATWGRAFVGLVLSAG